MGAPYRYPRTTVYPQAHRQLRRPARTGRSKKGFLWPYLLIGAAILASILPFFLAFTALFAFHALNLLLPGVHAGGVAIGGMTQTQAGRKLDRYWNQDRKLVVTAGSEAWSASPSDFGLWLDAPLTASNALQIGRGPDAGQEIGRVLSGEPANVDPAVVFLPNLARMQLERWALLVNRPPVEAAMVYHEGRWLSLPGTPGKQLDIEATLLQMQANPGAIFSTGVLALVVHPLLPQVSDLSQEAQRLQGLLDSPLHMRAYDPINDEKILWTAAPEDMSAWIRVTGHEGAPGIEVDAEKFNQYLATQQGRLGPGRVFDPLQSNLSLSAALQDGRPLTVTIRRLPTEYVVQPGDTLVSIGLDLGMPYWMIQEANPGLSAGSLSAGQVLTIPSANDLLPLPVIPDKRVVISISQQRLWEYENGNLRREEIVSTGIDRSPTYSGVFQIQTHELEAYASVWDLYMPHFLGIYEAVPGFMNGIHGLPTLSNGTRMWANALGRKASYGCIILTLEAAEDLYNWAEAGVVVEIQP